MHDTVASLALKALISKTPKAKKIDEKRKSVSATVYQRNSEQTEQKAGVLNVFGTNSWPKCL